MYLITLDLQMTKNTNPKHDDKKTEAKSKTASESQSSAWIPFRRGVILIALLSVGMTILTIYQAIQVKPLGDAILYGLGFGASLWLIFFGFILLNRLLGRH
jgi:hypothetical protein